MIVAARLWLMRMASSRLLASGAWALSGQVLAAAGVLFGVRVLTAYVSPEVYGATALLVGVAALGLGVLVGPLLQGALKFYPQWSSGGLEVLRQTVRVAIGKSLLVGVAVTVVLGVLLVVVLRIDVAVIPLCFGLLLVDSMRSLEATLLSASGNNRAVAILAIVEAWVRPMCAVIVVRVLGPSPGSVIAGYVGATACMLLVFYKVAAPVGVPASRRAIRHDEELLLALRTFARPVAPTSIVGWANGVGDRYLIGAFLGLQQAGVYSAVYGLVSKPFLVLGAAIELAFRPPYYQLVGVGRRIEAERLLRVWLGTLAAVLVILFVLVWLFESRIMNGLLSSEYRGGVALVPWIAGGYILSVMAEAFTRVCYMFSLTRAVLLIQVVGGVLGLAVSLVGIMQFGLMGAAASVPVYFGITLLMTVQVARRRHVL